MLKPLTSAKLAQQIKTKQPEKITSVERETKTEMQQFQIIFNEFKGRFLRSQRGSPAPKAKMRVFSNDDAYANRQQLNDTLRIN